MVQLLKCKHKIIFMKKLATLLIAIISISFNVNSQSNIESKDIYGFGFLNKIVGLWNGKVFSSTTAGSFDKWYVDFRPVSGSQVSQYSMLDSNTVNITSFFVVKYNNQIKVAQRTEGCFQDKCCVTYEVMDSVNEASGYYRFADFVSGKKRACTIYKFTKDSYTMEVYTNKFNKSEKLQLHSKFEPKLTSRVAANDAINEFKFPRPVIAKDLTGAFLNMNESIFFNLDSDPYNAASQPVMGNIKINITIDDKFKVSKSNEICILLTTEPLFEGIKYNKEKLNFLSKYVYLSVDTKTYTIKNVHPGKYYLYSFNDIDNDKKHLKGDYMSSNLTNVVKVLANGTVSADTKIDFVIP